MSLWFYDRNPKAKVIICVIYKARDDPSLQRDFLSSSVAVLTLAYVAQALVVVIGANIELWCANIESNGSPCR